MSDTITLKKADLLKAHAEGCSATKKALENLYPEVFKDEMDKLRIFHVYIGTGNVYSTVKGDPYIAIANEKGNYLMACLRTSTGMIGFQPEESYTKSKLVRPMKNGKLTITVTNGMLDGCKVEEFDY